MREDVTDIKDIITNKCIACGRKMRNNIKKEGDKYTFRAQRVFVNTEFKIDAPPGYIKIVLCKPSCKQTLASMLREQYGRSD